ncbi:class I SAM-dependent methyltransferase [Luminiphilus sp.]|nr:class I SAM-dependent methyltransferase [Luminiphilus sp.]
MDYGDTYKDWKDWSDDSFGVLKNSDNAYFKAELGGISDSLSRDSQVLEIGYGSGLFLKYARLQGWSILGVETNELLHELALKRGFKSILNKDIGELEGSVFDLVVVFDVIEHIPKSELANFFKKVHSLLKPGGTFISRFPNGDSPFGLYNQHGDLTHQTHIGSQAIEFLALEADFVIKSIRPAAEPIMTGSTIVFAHRLISRAIKFLLSTVVRLIWYPKCNYVYFASNVITTVLEKKD